MSTEPKASTIVDHYPGEVIETAICTICVKEESPGFYTGCLVRDGNVTDRQCENGMVTRHDPNDPLAGWYIHSLDADGTCYDSVGPYDSKAEAERIMTETANV